MYDIDRNNLIHLILRNLFDKPDSYVLFGRKYICRSDGGRFYFTYTLVGLYAQKLSTHLAVFRLFCICDLRTGVLANFLAFRSLVN